MTLVFFIQSNTVNLANYTLKDLPGSSGRFDVICRCILAALFHDNKIEKDVEVWLFLKNYGSYLFDSKKIDHRDFPKTEISLAKYFGDFITKKMEKNKPLYIKDVQLDFFTVLENFTNKNYSIITLSENGENFDDYFKKNVLFDNLLFIIGDQTGNLLKTEALKGLQLPNVSIGIKSYLASSVIRLVKIKLRNHKKTFKF